MLKFDAVVSEASYDLVDCFCAVRQGKRGASKAGDENVVLDRDQLRKWVCNKVCSDFVLV